MIQLIALTAHYTKNEFIIFSLLVFLASYAIGNINPAIISGWMNHVDIRKEGSGNAGMTNTIRVLGLGWGIAVFVVDILKAFISVKIAMTFSCGAQDTGLIFGMCAFAGVVIGHCYPAIYGFKGGKGVAASFGSALALNWPSALGALAVAGIAFLLSKKKMSIASIAAVVSYPLLIALLQDDKRLIFFGIGAALFLVVQHSANIKRIAKGEEKSLTIGRGASDHGTDDEKKTGE